MNFIGEPENKNRERRNLAGGLIVWVLALWFVVSPVGGRADDAAALGPQQSGKVRMGKTADGLVPGSGLKYFVDPNGNDEAAGTATSPWASIQKACESVEAGATVTVREGTYREMIYVEVEGSVEAGPVTIQAEGKVIVDVSGVDDVEHVFYIEDKSYLRIIGFEMRGLTTKDGSGIRFQGGGSHLEFRDNIIHNMQGKNAMGITVYGMDADNPVTNLAITGNEIFDCDAAPSEALVVNGNVDGFEIAFNHVHDINNIGIDMIGGERDIVDDAKAVVRNGVCRRNRVERARSNYGGGYGAGIYIDGGRDIVIEQNWISECDLGIEVGAENRGIVTSGIVVRNNVIFHNDKAGLAFGGYGQGAGRVERCHFLNNLIKENTGHKKAQAEVWIQWATDNVLRNNIVVGGTDSKAPLLAYEGGSSGKNRVDYNRWYGGVDGSDRFVWAGRDFASLAAFQKAAGLDAHSTWGDPQLSFGHSMDIELKAGSPCVDLGDPVYRPGAEVRDMRGAPRLAGKSVDIGPVEAP
jgi:hypothetical protein